jgi:hypothetical protein
MKVLHDFYISKSLEPSLVNGIATKGMHEPQLSLFITVAIS